jgi:hypothetical protein
MLVENHLERMLKVRYLEWKVRKTITLTSTILTPLSCIMNHIWVGLEHLHPTPSLWASGTIYDIQHTMLSILPYPPITWKIEQYKVRDYLNIITWHYGLPIHDMHFLFHTFLDVTYIHICSEQGNVMGKYEGLWSRLPRFHLVT